MEVIQLTRGDDSDTLGEKITITLSTDIDLTGFTATFQLANFRQNFKDISGKVLNLTFSKKDTKRLPLGLVSGGLKIYNPEGKAHTVIRDIPFEILSEVVRND
jgi:hypothetical protein